MRGWEGGGGGPFDLSTLSCGSQGGSSRSVRHLFWFLLGRQCLDYILDITWQIVGDDSRQDTKLASGETKQKRV